MQYWTTWVHYSAQTQWERTTARTLRGAKCVARRRYGGQLRDSVLRVGVTMREDERGRPHIVTVAHRPNDAGGRWYDY